MCIRALGTASTKICEITAEYEPLLNLSRSIKTLTEFVIETPRGIVEWIAWVVNPIFAMFAELVNFKPIVFSAESLEALEPFAKGVKQLRNGLNFFELPLAVKKFCASWHDKNTSSVKRFSNFITIPQKLMESFLIIPDDFNIIKLNEVALGWGKWCASKLGDSWAWQLFNRDGIFAVKEVFALQASVTNFVAYKKDYNRLQTKVNDKLQRNTIHLSPLKRTIDSIVAAEAPFGALTPMLTAFNGQAATRQQEHKKLKDLEKEVIALHAANDPKKEVLTARYFRRFFLENDVTGMPPVIPVDLPVSVRESLDGIMKAFPTPQSRIKRILTYKFDKSRSIIEKAQLSMKRDVVGWWYEVSKMTIITLGLLQFALKFNPLTCTLKTLVKVSTLSTIGKVVDFDSWCAKFFIGGAGLFRVIYINYKIKPQEERVKAAMPNPQLVFAL